jgi:hypothetical protein
MEPTTLSALFTAVERGEQPAAQALFGVLYDDLHRLARRDLARRAGRMSIGHPAAPSRSMGRECLGLIARLDPGLESC